MRLPKVALFIALLSPVLLSPVYAQRGGGRVGGGAVGGGIRGGYYGGRYWGPSIYFGLGGWGYPYYWGYPGWGYPYDWAYPYYEAYPYYWGYPYYGYRYYYPGPPVIPQQNPYPPQGQQPSNPPQSQPARPQQPSDPPPSDPPPDPPQIGGPGVELREFGLGRLLGDPDVRQQLGVTAAQAAKIRQQELDFQKTEIRNRAELRIKRLDLDELLSADKPDRSAIDSKLQEIGAVQIALEKSAIDDWLTMQAALTPAQRKRLEQLMTDEARPTVGGGRGVTPTAKAQGQAPPKQ